MQDNTCTFWIDGPWTPCCCVHDQQVAVATSKAMRKAADDNLRKCVTAKGYPHMAWVMWAGVRAWALLKYDIMRKEF